MIRFLRHRFCPRVRCHHCYIFSIFNAGNLLSVLGKKKKKFDTERFLVRPSLISAWKLIMPPIKILSRWVCCALSGLDPRKAKSFVSRLPSLRFNPLARPPQSIFLNFPSGPFDCCSGIWELLPGVCHQRSSTAFYRSISCYSSIQIFNGSHRPIHFCLTLHFSSAFPRRPSQVSTGTTWILKRSYSVELLMKLGITLVM